MGTTSLKLTDELKERAAAVAQEQGISTHAFLVQAISQATDVAERRAAFVAEAGKARAALLKNGRGYEADDVHAYLKRRAAGEKVRRPKAKPWRG